MSNVEFLKVDKEMLEVAAKTELDLWREHFTKTLQEAIIIPCGAHLIKLDIYETYYHDFQIEINIGFWNDDEDRVDFGSDIYIYYNNQGAQFNHGTIGSFYSNDKYQMNRLKLFGFIYDNIHIIEELLSDAMAKANNYINHIKQINNISNELRRIEAENQRIAKQEIENKIKVGTPIKVLHAKDWQKHFNECFYRDTDEYVIEKINPKNVKVRVTTPESYVAQIQKTTLIDLIYIGRITIG